MSEIPEIRRGRGGSRQAAGRRGVYAVGTDWISIPVPHTEPQLFTRASVLEVLRSLYPLLPWLPPGTKRPARKSAPEL